LSFLLSSGQGRISGQASDVPQARELHCHCRRQAHLLNTALRPRPGCC
jgi:hypothetical protein